MKSTINEHDFRDRFHRMDRGNQFSYDGLTALFTALEEYEEDTGEQIEFDVIALCCEFTEYDNLEEFHSEYDHEEYPDVESIEDSTQVIKFNTESFIIGQL